MVLFILRKKERFFFFTSIYFALHQPINDLAELGVSDRSGIVAGWPLALAEPIKTFDGSFAKV